MKLNFVFISLFMLYSCESQKTEKTEKIENFETPILNDYFCSIQILEHQNSSNFIVIEENALFDILKKTRCISLNQFQFEIEKLKSNEMKFKIKDSIEYKLLNPYIINLMFFYNDSIANNIINSLKKNKKIIRYIITDTKCTLIVLCQNNFIVRQDDESGSFVILNPLHPNDN
jgi:hypothetical protein